MARDEAYLLEDSPMWRLHRERLVSLSAPRALLLQASHPLVWAGLLENGRALEQAHARLNRTTAALGTAAFGPRREADRVGRRVRNIHRAARGELAHDAGRFAAGTPYAADDPELLLWVLAAIFDSALVAHDRCVRPLSRDERDDVWQDYRVLGAIFGLAAQDTPETIEDFDTYMAGMLEGADLHVSADARALATRTALGPPVPRRLRPLTAVIGLVTVAWLPPRLRHEYGLSWGPARRALLGTAAWGSRRIVVPLLPDRLRQVRVATAPRPIAETRPVLVGQVRREDDAVFVVSEGTELRVEGEPDLARRVLSLCDGGRSPEEIVAALGAPDARDDVYALMEILVEHGALRDAAAR